MMVITMDVIVGSLLILGVVLFFAFLYLRAVFFLLARRIGLIKTQEPK